MTQYEGIRTASDAELENGLHVLADQRGSAEPLSPLWRASTYWIGRTIAEVERRYRADWGNDFDFAQRGYGDDA
jgi:hypothetical protein